MQYFFRKVFSLQDIKYSWLLLISVMIFMTTFYLDLHFGPSKVQMIALVGYGSAFIVATLWGASNYIGHVRINALYQKNNDIQAFVSQLAVNKEEKKELQMYLEDYAQDQVNQGKARNEAAKEAIGQFKIGEFSSLSKSTMIFHLHAHYYLGGWALIAMLAALIFILMGNAFSSLFVLVLGYTFLFFGVGFVVLFCIYKVVDVALYKKIKA